MKILTNEYGYIVSYAIKGDLKDGVEVGHLDNPFEYQYIEGKLIHNPIPEVPKGFIKPVYTGSEFVETATIEEIFLYEKNIALMIEEDHRLGLEDISDDEMKEVKQYIKAIKPENAQTIPLITRPEIMSIYQACGKKKGNKGGKK